MVASAPVSHHHSDNDMASSPDAGTRGFIAVNHASSNGMPLVLRDEYFRILTAFQKVILPADSHHHRITPAGEVSSLRRRRPAHISNRRTRMSESTSGNGLGPSNKDRIRMSDAMKIALPGGPNHNTWPIEPSMFLEALITGQQDTTRTVSIRMDTRGNRKGRYSNTTLSMVFGLALPKPSWSRYCKGKRTHKMHNRDPGILHRVQTDRSVMTNMVGRRRLALHLLAQSENATLATERRRAA